MEEKGEEEGKEEDGEGEEEEEVVEEEEEVEEVVEVVEVVEEDVVEEEVVEDTFALDLNTPLPLLLLPPLDFLPLLLSLNWTSEFFHGCCSSFILSVMYALFSS